MTKVIMNGCNGKMGQCITEICARDEDIEIVAGIDTYSGIQNEYPVFASLNECNISADVIIDFSSADGVDALLDYCCRHQLPVVLCTTGLSEEQLKKTEQAYEKTAVLKSANMSLGINTLLELLRKAALVFAPAGFDMEIVEKHHEVITFKHTAYSKAVFAKGAVEAAKFLKGKPAGHYDMADVIAAK